MTRARLIVAAAVMLAVAFGGVSVITAGTTTSPELAVHTGDDATPCVDGSRATMTTRPAADGVHISGIGGRGGDVFMLPAYPGSALVSTKACMPVLSSAHADATWTTAAPIDTVRTWYLGRGGAQPMPTPDAQGQVPIAVPRPNGPNDVFFPAPRLPLPEGGNGSAMAVHFERPVTGGVTIVTVTADYSCPSC